MVQEDTGQEHMQAQFHSPSRESELRSYKGHLLCLCITLTMWGSEKEQRGAVNFVDRLSQNESVYVNISVK